MYWWEMIEAFHKTFINLIMDHYGVEYQSDIPAEARLASIKEFIELEEWLTKNKKMIYQIYNLSTPISKAALNSEVYTVHYRIHHREELKEIDAAVNEEMDNFCLLIIDSYIEEKEKRINEQSN